MKNRYREGTKQLKFAKNGRKIMFWLSCNMLLRYALLFEVLKTYNIYVNFACSVKNEDTLISCTNWGLEMCLEWTSFWHYGISWHDNLETKYNEYAFGKDVQLCPKCNNFMEKAIECNHLTWPRCMWSYWIYCRHVFSDDHTNPLNSKACTMLTKAQKTVRVSKMPLSKVKFGKITKLVFS